MSYEDKILIREANKEIADLKMEIIDRQHSDDMNTDMILKLTDDLEAKAKENKRLYKDYWIQNKCIADQHDRISELNKQLDVFNNGSRLF